MIHIRQSLSTAFLLAALLGCASPESKPPAGGTILVSSIDAFNRAVDEAQPGDEIILANGTWRDVELVLRGKGTAAAPIRLSAERPGQVIISGQSNLSLSGEHLVVSGLVFRDGYTPTSEVVSFRTSKDELANHSRVTNIVIDSFSNPERHSSDTWVAIYGKHNRFDQNTLVNKGNHGVTLAVRLNTEASLANWHIIENNYFGPRQTLGSNGGETLRIGTSHYSREFSNTIVRRNYFDRTSGELEIISSKSRGNRITGNVFFESQGTLTMRHGNFTTVEGNYFLGNRKPNTGGIRIINENQTVRRNYLYGLTGHRFNGAIVIMNGVPNGPINRYDPVVDSILDNNIIIDSDHIQLCAGSDEERSAPPTDTTMRNNILMSRTNPDAFTVYDDISGISFTGNIVSRGIKPPVAKGFTELPYSVAENAQGLAVPPQSLIDQIEFGEVSLPITREEVGAHYYPKSNPTVAFRSGGEVAVAPGTNTLIEALYASDAGDVLVLENGSEYLLTKYADLRHPVSIIARAGDKPVIRSEKNSFLIIRNGGALELENLWFDGTESPDVAGNNVISTDRYSMNRNYSLRMKDLKVTNLNVNHSFDFLRVYRNTFADLVELIDSEITNVTGAVFAMDEETDDLGIYNVENLRIENSVFTDVEGAVANIYRGGTDESTFGPMVTVSGVTLNSVGLGKRNKAGASMLFHGVQRLDIANSILNSSAPLELFLTNGEPITRIRDVVMKDTQAIRANTDDYDLDNVSYE